MNNDNTELYCGGTAEDWHNAYSNLVRGKDLIEHELYSNARRAEGELKNQRDAKEHWKSKCESLVACLESDYGLDASWDGLRKFWNIERVRPERGSVNHDTVKDAIKVMLEDMANERFVYFSTSTDRHRMREIVDDCAERIHKAVDGPSNGHLWVSETEYNSLVDMAEECQKWRDEYKKMGEQLDRLRNEEGVA